MKKLSLRLDDISVTGFEVVAPETRGEGTVVGAAFLTRQTYCDQETCGYTCAPTCDPGFCS
jgi:hypothetical protein